MNQTFVSSMEHQSEGKIKAIEQEIRALESRDLQLWSIALVALFIILAGFVALIAPRLLWHLNELVTHDQNLATLLLGLICLLVLLNVYLFTERRMLLSARHELVQQLCNAEKRAYTDALTGLYNRRFMEDALKREIERVKRNDSNLSIMLSDVNNFKDFNTRFGHLMGDRILVEVGVLLQKNFRAADIIIRYGGDEFLVIMPETSLSQAMVAIERLQRLLTRWNGAEYREYTLGLSSGVAIYFQGDRLEDVIKAADADLYVRKAASKQPQPAL
ncbi:MAG: GGDEF domain-containing protein [Acidobacteria bacterium]|nr:GGDEF domain-containing protein [Acidobacteriota bacterium]